LHLTSLVLLDSVVGDTVGDPFKDTSGPSLNILIKLMSIISLTIAPLIEGDEDWDRAYFGLIPFGALVIGAYLVYRLFWLHGQDITAAPVSSHKGEASSNEDDGTNKVETA
jgi:Inorganic H+ pyrophosphatase